MPKRIGNIYNANLTFEKLLVAHNKAKKGKRYKKSVILFEMNLEENLINILEELKCGNYKLGKYNSFVIYEPKERLIKSLPYKDKVVQMWYVENFIKPIFLKIFIKETYACIPCKGVHKAMKKTQELMKLKNRETSEYWILKCDIKKFFFNINQQKLYDFIKRKIKDKKFLKLTREIIFNNEDSIGIPIGNYSSQYFANLYLNKLDRFVKDNLNCKYYVRYMDDFILLLDNKCECKDYKEKIKIFLSDYLKLDLNKKTEYFKSKQGVNFCGYRIFKTHVLVRNSNKIRNRRKFKKFKKKLLFSCSNVKSMRSSFVSVRGNIKHANSYGLYNYYYRIFK